MGAAGRTGRDSVSMAPDEVGRCSDDALLQVARQGDTLGKKLNAVAEAHPGLVREVRGLGLMWGMELADQGPAAVRQALAQGLVINCTAGNVLRFLPPLIITEKETDEAVRILDNVLTALPCEAAKA